MYDYDQGSGTKDLTSLERRRARCVLRRQMLEQQAINSDPDSFDIWADQIDACDEEIRRIVLDLLNVKRSMILAQQHDV